MGIVEGGVVIGGAADGLEESVDDEGVAANGAEVVQVGPDLVASIEGGGCGGAGAAVVGDVDGFVDWWEESAQRADADAGERVVVPGVSVGRSAVPDGVAIGGIGVREDVVGAGAVSKDVCDENVGGGVSGFGCVLDGGDGAEDIAGCGVDVDLAGEANLVDVGVAVEAAKVDGEIGDAVDECEMIEQLDGADIERVGGVGRRIGGEDGSVGVKIEMELGLVRLVGEVDGLGHVEERRGNGGGAVGVGDGDEFVGKEFAGRTGCGIEAIGDAHYVIELADVFENVPDGGRGGEGLLASTV